MHTTIEIANAVLTKMQALVSGEVLSYLESVLMSELRGIELEVNALSNVEDEASKYMERFLAAKTIEGCSPKTIRYYKATLTRALEAIKKPIYHPPRSSRLLKRQIVTCPTLQKPEDRRL